jgi:hypothetical protein
MAIETQVGHVTMISQLAHVEATVEKGRAAARELRAACEVLVEEECLDGEAERVQVALSEEGPHLDGLEHALEEVEQEVRTRIGTILARGA